MVVRFICRLIASYRETMAEVRKMKEFSGAMTELCDTMLEFGWSCVELGDAVRDYEERSRAL